MSRKFFTSGQERALVNAYQAGSTSVDLSRQYGCDKSTVIDALHRHGLVLRNKGKARLAEIDRRRDEIVARYHAGESVWAIKQSFGCSSTNAIRRVLREGGVPHPEHRLCVGDRHHAWKGGHHLDQSGYRRVKLRKSDPLYPMCAMNSYVMEHRLVMARALGRLLERHESVHHIDGNRQNNALANLELRQGKHGNGVRFVCRDCGSHNVEAVALTAGES